MSVNNRMSNCSHNMDENNKARDATSRIGAAAAADGDNNDADASQLGPQTNNIFCDIIAQQQEFQMRQDQRVQQCNFLLRARTRQLELEREELQQCNFAATARPNSSAANFNSSSTDASFKQNSIPRRKFSLSYAMSSLTAFTATAMPVTPTPTPKTMHQQSGQQHRLEHQASMISSADLFAARSRVKSHRTNTPDSNFQDTSGFDAEEAERILRELNQDPKESVKKSRGFVHKAIRRGSKMFDSMLLQSAQRQSAESAPDREKQGSESSELEKSQLADLVDNFANLENSTNDPNNHFSNSNSSTDNQNMHQNLPYSTAKGVQFALSNKQQQQQQQDDCDQSTIETGQHQKASWRRRKLTLGSLPSDLRRALSFNTTHHAHSKHSQEFKTQQDANKTQFNASSVDEPNNNNNESGIKHQLAPHMKRKNSLFSALSSVNPAQLVKSSRERDKAAAAAAASIEAANQFALARDKSLEHRARMQASSQNVSLSLCLDHSRTYKLIIYGSGAVGKTSLIQRFLYGHFPASHKPTVEELHSNKYNIPDVGEIYLEILDTSGTFEFPAMRRLSIEKGDAFILVFSVLDPASWQEVINLRQMILEHKGQGKMPPPPPPPPPQQSKLSRDHSDDSDETEHPISSIYAAATKLTSMQRRASCVIPSAHAKNISIGSGAGANQTQQPQQVTNVGQTARRRLSVCSPTNNQSQNQDNSPSRIRTEQAFAEVARQSPTAALNIQSPSSAHYNSQLSRLLQLAPVSDTSGKLGLLESGNSLDEQQESPESPQQGATSSGGHHFGYSVGSASINKRGVAKRTVSMAPNSALSRENKKSGNFANKLQRDNLHDESNNLGIFKRTTTPIVVAANKCDTPQSDWLVDLEEAERLVCSEWGHSFVRCSAREAQNTDRVFKELLRQAQAPPNLSESVIDDNQLRRQSLPVLKNQLSVSQMKGLRNLYNLHQKGSTTTTSQQQQAQALSASGVDLANQSTSSSSAANYQAKLSSSKRQYQNSFNYEWSSGSEQLVDRDHENKIVAAAQSTNKQAANQQQSSRPKSSHAHTNSLMGARSSSSASDDSQCIIS